MCVFFCSIFIDKRCVLGTLLAIWTFAGIQWRCLRQMCFFFCSIFIDNRCVLGTLLATYKYLSMFFGRVCCRFAALKYELVLVHHPTLKQMHIKIQHLFLPFLRLYSLECWASKYIPFLGVMFQSWMIHQYRGSFSFSQYLSPVEQRSATPWTWRARHPRTHEMSLD